MSNLTKEELLTLSENISLQENKVLEEQGTYRVETENIQMILQYPTKSGFFTMVTMALELNGKNATMITYNFEDAKELKFFEDMVKLDFGPRRENYFYSSSSEKVQVIVQQNVRLYLDKSTIGELYAALNKIHLQLLKIKNGDFN